MNLLSPLFYKSGNKIATGKNHGQIFDFTPENYLILSLTIIFESFPSKIDTIFSNGHTKTLKKVTKDIIFFL